MIRLETKQVSKSFDGKKVIEDISIYFKEKLNIQLELFRSNSYRTNLEYQVFQKSQQEEKYTCLREIIELKKCPTIIYVARTRQLPPSQRV